MQLENLPRYSLGFLPTPLHPLPNLTKRLGGSQLWIKRDDQTGLALGGNKTRKLEFLLGDALGQDANLLMTTGAPQSNHARQTAAAAAKAGLRSILVLRGTPQTDRTGNILIDDLIGAEVRWAGDRAPHDLMKTIAEVMKGKGSRPYLIPYGGSNGIGAVGYVLAMQEMLDQAKALNVNFDAIVFATSSGGTQAGLVVGARRAGYTGRILGISVDQVKGDFVPKMTEIANAVASRIDLEAMFSDEDFEVNDHYLGQGYGIMGAPERDAIRRMAQSEGLLIDPVYTGRAMAGLVDLIRKSEFRSDQNVLFWHTGGTPALFAYSKQFEAG
jgi:D-cysteine desulfhydrase